MTTIRFVATLLSDAVVSERSATAGGHRSLDHIPGSCFLGAAAATLYDRLGADAFAVFHSGKVRFGNAYPLDADHRPTVPVPASFHFLKGEEPDNALSGINNLVRATDEQFKKWNDDGVQWKQIRSGFVSRVGKFARPSKRYRLKTAIDRSQGGRSSEGQLFGYESLAAGSRWSFTVSFDPDVRDETRKSVVEALIGSIRIGRSRSAEYGLLETRVVEGADPVHALASSAVAVLFLLSDAAFSDPATGMPTLIPPSEQFGLPAGSVFLPNRSYVRVRSYASFNGTRRAFDIERQVVSKGSVLVFRNAVEGTNFSVDELKVVANRLSEGVGLYRQEGLGQGLVNPPFLADLDVKAESDGPTFAPTKKPEGKAPPLAAWLEKKAKRTAEQVETVAKVDDWISNIAKANNAPKNSQWGRLRRIALLKSYDEMKKAVSDVCGVDERDSKTKDRGVSAKQWDKKFEGKSYREFLLKDVLVADDLVKSRARLYLLANRLPKRINQKKKEVA